MYIILSGDCLLYISCSLVLYVDDSGQVVLAQSSRAVGVCRVKGAECLQPQGQDSHVHIGGSGALASVLQTVCTVH